MGYNHSGTTLEVSGHTFMILFAVFTEGNNIFCFPFSSRDGKV